jgi:tubulin polyglutamylase TTLL2
MGDKKAIWICKPAELSRGRGISLVTDLAQLAYEQKSIIQLYIPNPLLIRGYKWDMRIYVLVTRMRPLTVFLYKEGIARLSSDRYDTKRLGNVFSHLTNTSINK